MAAKDPGLKANELIVSSGGDVTSISFIGLYDCIVVVADPNRVFVPICPNIFQNVRTTNLKISQLSITTMKWLKLATPLQTDDNNRQSERQCLFYHLLCIPFFKTITQHKNHEHFLASALIELYKLKT